MEPSPGTGRKLPHIVRLRQSMYQLQWGHPARVELRTRQKCWSISQNFNGAALSKGRTQRPLQSSTDSHKRFNRAVGWAEGVSLRIPPIALNLVASKGPPSDEDEAG